jgi:hypothetical protein
MFDDVMRPCVRPNYCVYGFQTIPNSGFVSFVMPQNASPKESLLAHNGWHMSSGGFRSESLSTEAETTIEVLHLVTHKPRHYLYAVLVAVIIFQNLVP